MVDSFADGIAARPYDAGRSVPEKSAQNQDERWKVVLDRTDEIKLFH
jgi:hypothetical protein